MAEERGRFNPVKERLIDLIALSDPTLQPNTAYLHVHGEWKRPAYKQFRYLPKVSVRVSPINVSEAVYGRIFSGGNVPANIEEGSMSMFSFTAHIHTSANDSGTGGRGKYAQDLADTIIDYLIDQSPNQSAYGIEDIYSMNYRESDIDGQGFSLCRVILSGRLDCKRFDA